MRMCRNTAVAFIKAASLEMAQKVVELNDNKHELTVDGTSYKLRLMMEDGAVVVRLHNLSEDVTNEKITKSLSAHGEILSIREELSDENHYFPGLPTGIRNVRMTIKKGIASYVTIDGETTLVSYNGQQQTCRYCGEYIHNGISCVSNKKLLVQKLAINSSSYADVIKNSNPPRSNATRPNAARPTGPKVLGQKPSLPKQRTSSANTSKSVASSSMPSSVGVETIEVDLDGFLKPADVQDMECDNTWTKVTRKSSSQHKTDGNETDSSSSSRRSQRQTMKKMRCDDANTPNNNDSEL